MLFVCLSAAVAMQITQVINPKQLTITTTILWFMVSVDIGWDMIKEIGTIVYIRKHKLQDLAKPEYTHQKILAVLQACATLTGCIISGISGAILLNILPNQLPFFGSVGYAIFVIFLVGEALESIRYSFVFKHK